MPLICLFTQVLFCSLPDVGWIHRLEGAIGPILGDASRFGFDMAFPAVFLVLLRGMWKSLHAARPELVSLVTAALAYLYLPQGWHIPIGAVAGIASAY